MADTKVNVTLWILLKRIGAVPKETAPHPKELYINSVPASTLLLTVSVR